MGDVHVTALRRLWTEEHSFPPLRPAQLHQACRYSKHGRAGTICRVIEILIEDGSLEQKSGGYVPTQSGYERLYRS